MAAKAIEALDIAKESADMIFLEKSLMVLVSGVVEGRKVFANILKYAQDSYYTVPNGIEVAEPPTEPKFRYAFAASEPENAPATIEELSKRLMALESKESRTEAELKKLGDAKKPAAEKPKFPNDAINGVFKRTLWHSTSSTRTAMRRSLPLR